METIHQQRRTALITIANLAQEHGLPTPAGITFQPDASGGGRITLRIDDEQRDAVAAWAEVLGIGMKADMPVPSREFVSVSAETWRQRGSEPVWLSFRGVEVWSACDKAGEKA